MHCVTKAKPFQFIDSNILKSCKTCLTNHTRPVLHHWLLMPLGADTHIPMHEQNDFKKPGVHAFGLTKLKVCNSWMCVSVCLPHVKILIIIVKLQTVW